MLVEVVSSENIDEVLLNLSGFSLNYPKFVDQRSAVNDDVNSQLICKLRDLPKVVTDKSRSFQFMLQNGVKFFVQYL